MMDVDTTKPLLSLLWQYAHQHVAKSRPSVVLPQKKLQSSYLNQ